MIGSGYGSLQEVLPIIFRLVHNDITVDFLQLILIQTCFSSMAGILPCERYGTKIATSHHFGFQACVRFCWYIYLPSCSKKLNLLGICLLWYTHFFPQKRACSFSEGYSVAFLRINI